MPVSEAQKRLLARATSLLALGSYTDVVGLLHQTVTDPDLVSGREELDTGWLMIWEQLREHARSVVPAHVYNEIEERIGLPIDELLWGIRLLEKERIAILLGAGASKPKPSNIPTVVEFLPELWRRAQKLDRDDLNRLREWCIDNSIQNIEDLLTATHLANFAARNTGVLRLLDYYLLRGEDNTLGPIRGREGFSSRVVPGRLLRRTVLTAGTSGLALLQDTLQTLFALLTEPMLAAEPNSAHKAITALLKEHSGADIITTNYDGCIDQALEEAELPFEYGLSESGASVERDGTALIKMHGSINWFYCESCQEMKMARLGDIRDGYRQDKVSYPVIGICKNCGGQRRPMIVPPLSFKFLMFPPLAGLWARTQKAFEESSIIIAVGYSFSEVDSFMTQLVSKAMGSNPEKRLIIVDTNRSLVDTIRQRLAAHIDGFDETRVIRAAQSCDEILPKLCSSLLGTAKEAK